MGVHITFYFLSQSNFDLLLYYYFNSDVFIHVSSEPLQKKCVLTQMFISSHHDGDDDRRTEHMLHYT